jgi:hypothetical protein
MNTQFPVVPSNYSQSFFNLLMQRLASYFGQATAKDEETPRIVLRSPSGKNFDLTVSDAGVLVVTPTSKTRV